MNMTEDVIEELQIPLVPNPLEKGVIVRIVSSELPNTIVLEDGVKKTLPEQLDRWLPMAARFFPCNVEFGQLASFPFGKVYANFVEDDGSDIIINKKNIEENKDVIGTELVGLAIEAINSENHELFQTTMGSLMDLSCNEGNSLRTTGYYIFKITTSKEVFYKGGISYEPKQRAWSIQSAIRSGGCKNATVEIIQSVHAPNRAIAENFEQNVLKYSEDENITYKPKVVFKGYTECFSCNPFDTIDMTLAEFLLR